MRTWMLAVLLGVVAGCSGFTAKSGMAKYIDAQAVRAQVDLKSAQAGTLDANAALVSARQNAEACGLYAAEKTTNPFAYLFGPNTILVNATIAQDLDAGARITAEIYNRAGTKPADWLRMAVIKGSPLVVDVKHFKDATVNPD